MLVRAGLVGSLADESARRYVSVAWEFGDLKSATTPDAYLTVSTSSGACMHIKQSFRSVDSPSAPSPELRSIIPNGARAVPCTLIAGIVLLVALLCSSQVRAQSVTFTRLITTDAGRGRRDGTGAGARFSNPTAIAVDAAGNVFVADTRNSTIRRISPAGVVRTLAGITSNHAFSDGAGANAAFNHPQGIAVDTNGYVYVADTSNNAIRKITPSGVVSTLAGGPGVAQFSFRLTWRSMPAGTSTYTTGGIAPSAKSRRMA